VARCGWRSRTPKHTQHTTKAHFTSTSFPCERKQNKSVRLAGHLLCGRKPHRLGGCTRRSVDLPPDALGLSDQSRPVDAWQVLVQLELAELAAGVQQSPMGADNALQDAETSLDTTGAATCECYIPLQRRSQGIDGVVASQPPVRHLTQRSCPCMGRGITRRLLPAHTRCV